MFSLLKKPESYVVSVAARQPRPQRSCVSSLEAKQKPEAHEGTSVIAGFNLEIKHRKGTESVQTLFLNFDCR